MSWYSTHPLSRAKSASSSKGLGSSPMTSGDSWRGSPRPDMNTTWMFLGDSRRLSRSRNSAPFILGIKSSRSTSVGVSQRSSAASAATPSAATTLG